MVLTWMPWACQARIDSRNGSTLETLRCRAWALERGGEQPILGQQARRIEPTTLLSHPPDARHSGAPDPLRVRNPAIGFA